MPRPLRGRVEPLDPFRPWSSCDPWASLCPWVTPHTVKRFIELAIVARTRSHALALTYASHHACAPHEPEAVHPCRYRGPAAGRFAAVAHARLAARRYYATRWLAEGMSAIWQRVRAGAGGSPSAMGWTTPTPLMPRPPTRASLSLLFACLAIWVAGLVIAVASSISCADHETYASSGV